jgi:hypothetical protein
VVRAQLAAQPPACDQLVDDRVRKVSGNCGKGLSLTPDGNARHRRKMTCRHGTTHVIFQRPNGIATGGPGAETGVYRP